MLVEVYSDIACPWCYIGFHRFRTALAQAPYHDQVEVVWKAFELDPDAPVGAAVPEVDALSARKGLPAGQIREMFAQVSAVGAELGLDLDFDTTLSANTFDAHRLVHLAAERGGTSLADRMHEALWQAHFAQGEAIDDRNVLADLAAEIGLDRAEIVMALDSDAGADGVRADGAEARALGITGVPFFVLDRAFAVSGAQPVDVFRSALDQAWQQRSPLTTVGGDGEACGPDGCAI